jgi:hypothetical protein
MRDLRRGAAGCGTASEVLAAPVALRGAMALLSEADCSKKVVG